jgi:hypothetical protein
MAAGHRLLANLQDEAASAHVHDLAVVCRDGTVRTAGLLLAAASPLLRAALVAAEAEAVVLVPWLGRAAVAEALSSLLRPEPRLSEEALGALAGLGVSAAACSTGPTMGGNGQSFGDHQYGVMGGRPETEALVIGPSYKGDGKDRVLPGRVRVKIRNREMSESKKQQDAELQVATHEAAEDCALEGHSSIVASPVLREDKSDRNLCNTCGKTFYDKRELQMHETAIHKERNLPCSYCNKLYPSEAHRSKHENTVHATELAHQCSECPQRYRHPSSLHKHVLSVHRGQEARRFRCGHCDKAFISNSKLTSHARIHTGEKLFGCDQCNKSFADQSAASRHRKTHAGDRRFGCDLCPKTYSQSYDVVKHKMLVHGVQIERRADHPNKGKKLKRDQKPGRFSEEVLCLELL